MIYSNRLIKLFNINDDTVYIDGTKIDKIKVNYHNIKNVVADAGYESLLNYRYLEENEYISYTKSQYYEQSKKRSFKKDINRPENVIYDETDNILMRKDGVI